MGKGKTIKDSFIARWAVLGGIILDKIGIRITGFSFVFALIL